MGDPVHNPRFRVVAEVNPDELVKTIENVET